MSGYSLQFKCRNRLLKAISQLSKRSRACIIANALIKQGMSRSAAMVRAWRTVKQRVIHTKTAGVTHGNRQALLDRLTRYSAEEISITLNREPEYAAVKNAVQVIAAELACLLR